MLLSSNLTCQIKRFMGYFSYVTTINVYMGYLFLFYFMGSFLTLQQKCIYCTVYLFYGLFMVPTFQLHHQLHYIFIISYYAMFQFTYF